MRFRYIGDRDSMTAFGYEFRHDVRGDFTPDVTNPHALKKLVGNSHFEAVADGEEEHPAELKRRGRKPKADGETD